MTRFAAGEQQLAAQRHGHPAGDRGRQGCRSRRLLPGRRHRVRPPTPRPLRARASLANTRNGPGLGCPHSTASSRRPDRRRRLSQGRDRTFSGDLLIRVARGEVVVAIGSVALGQTWHRCRAPRHLHHAALPGGVRIPAPPRASGSRGAAASASASVRPASKVPPPHRRARPCARTRPGHGLAVRPGG